jgi:excisionase family DNA binding protein
VARPFSDENLRLVTAAPIAEQPPRLLYSFDEAADALRCSGRQVRNLVDEGAIRSVHIGRLHRIAHDDLTSYVERLQAGAER